MSIDNIHRTAIITNKYKRVLSKVYVFLKYWCRRWGTVRSLKPSRRRRPCFYHHTENVWKMMGPHVINAKRRFRISVPSSPLTSEQSRTGKLRSPLNFSAGQHKRRWNLRPRSETRVRVKSYLTSLNGLLNNRVVNAVRARRRSFVPQRDTKFPFASSVRIVPSRSTISPEVRTHAYIYEYIVRRRADGFGPERIPGSASDTVFGTHPQEHTIVRGRRRADVTRGRRPRSLSPERLPAIAVRQWACVG